MIITIDGPIATGKSTIAKKLAEKLGFIYFDTGAMYRCLTYAVVEKGINLDNLTQLQNFLDTFEFDIKMHHAEKRYFVNGEDVTIKIRNEMVTKLVSKVSAIESVRKKLVDAQRNLAVGVNVVFEGRDMGTVVFPNAHLKIFLTGRIDERAKRRHRELREKFPQETAELTLAQTTEDITKRDTYDSTRLISPLRQAEDAYVVDTSDLSVEEIVSKILEYMDSIPSH